jgi:hypothetical protein
MPTPSIDAPCKHYKSPTLQSVFQSISFVVFFFSLPEILVYFIVYLTTLAIAQIIQRRMEEWLANNDIGRDME